MDFNKETIIRGIVLFFGLIFFISGLIFLINALIPLFNNLGLQGISSILNTDYSSLLLYGIMLFLGVILLEVAITWKKFLLTLAKWAISFSLFFLLIGFFLLSLNYYSQDLVNSIQPSIDYLVLNQLNKNLENNSQNYGDTSLNLIFSKGINKTTFFVKNLTSSQAEYIAKELKISDLNEDKKIYFVKVLLSNTYNSIKLSQPTLLNSTLSLSIFNREILEKNGLNFNLLYSTDLDNLKQTFNINNEAKLTFIISSNQITKEISINSISEEDINLIWDNLGFSNSNLSTSSKKKTIEYFFYGFIASLKNQDLEQLPAIEVTTIPSTQPKSFTLFEKFDIFNNNLSIASSNLDGFRTECLNTMDEDDFICSQFLITDYSNFISILDNLTSKNDSNLIHLNLKSKYATLDDLTNTINEKSSNFTTYFLFWLALLFLGLLFILVYKKLTLTKDQKVNFISIFYDFFKIHFWSYLFNFILTAILYYIINSEILISLLSKYSPQNFSEIILSFIKMPFYPILIKIINLTFYLALIYFILSLIFYILFFFLKKFNSKKVGCDDLESNINKKEKEVSTKMLEISNTSIEETN